MRSDKRLFTLKADNRTQHDKDFVTEA